MSSFKDAYLTDNGADLIAKSIADGTKIEFVKMVVGDGEYEDAEKTKDALRQRTRLKSQRQECGFSSVEATKENAVKLKAVISNKNVTEGYRIRELGIVAKLSGDTTTEGILYSVAVAEEADYLPAEDTPISYIQEYYTKVSNAESVTINVNMGAYATAEDVEKLSKPIYAEAENLEELTSGEELETALGKIKKAVNTLINHITKKASLSVLGHVKLSDSEAVTDAEGLALSAKEKNASIEGTLANQIDKINTDLNSLSYTGLPDAVTGSFGNYVNVKAGAFKHGKFAVLCFSGQVTGTVDISLTAFGLDKSAKVSAIFTSECTIAKTDGTNGGTLTVKCYRNDTSLQLRSSVDGDYYTALIPVLLN